MNELYPIFLKTNQFHSLIVGGGNVGLEKSTFLLKSSPNSKVKVIATYFHPELIELAEKHAEVNLVKKEYHISDITNQRLIIACTDNEALNEQVKKDGNSKNILVNVADTPDLCDFYLGGIVTKGDIKIAISTNGKSPTLAKRLRQFFEEFLPDEINDLASSLNNYRKTLATDFEGKVIEMNKMTKDLLHSKSKNKK